MELAFVNGSNVQRAACETAARNLLNLPFESIPLRVTVEFVADPLESAHNEFAATEFNYDSPEATIRVASVAPNWPDPWRGIRFLQETFAHELGHALYAVLSEDIRTAIARLFGAKTDGLGELQPEGTRWEDRYIEGIAETFKDAFLPRRFRAFANRTNRKLSISRYPEFRSLVRRGVEATNIPGGPLYAHDVLELDEANLAEAWNANYEIDDVWAGFTFGKYTAGYDLFVRTLPAPFTFAYSLQLLLEDLPFPVHGEAPSGQGDSFFAWRYRIKVNGVVKNTFRGAWFRLTPNSPSIGQLLPIYGDYRAAALEFDGPEEPSIPTPGETWWDSADIYGEGGLNAYRLFEDAKALGLPDVTISSSVSAQAGDKVEIHARALGIESVPRHLYESGGEKLGYLSVLSEILPEMFYEEEGIDGIEGGPAPVPLSAIGPEARAAEIRRTRRRVVGAHFES